MDAILTENAQNWKAKVREGERHTGPDGITWAHESNCA